MNDPSKPEFWDERYESEEYFYGTEPNGYLESVAQLIPSNSKILCLADGEGRNGVYLAQKGHRTTCVDMSTMGLSKARMLADKKGVAIETVAADLLDYNQGEARWDAIVSIFFHASPKVRDIVYQRTVRALRPGGLLILEAYTPKQIEFGTGGPPLAELMMTADILRETFLDLEIESLEELERDVVEGSGHTGHAAVVQLLAHNKVST